MPEQKNSTHQPPEPTVDRTALQIVGLGDDLPDDKTYWHTRTPHERLEHLEYLRWINYGSEATARLQRIFEVVERKSS